MKIRRDSETPHRKRRFPLVRASIAAVVTTVGAVLVIGKVKKSRAS